MNFNRWKETKLDEIIEFNPRETISRGKVAKKVPMGRLIPFQKEIDGYELAEFSGGSKFRNGDTLLARITPCLENGKTAKVTILDDGEVGYGSTEYIVMREKTRITDGDFVYYLSISPKFRDIAIKSMVGTSGRQRVQLDVIENTIMAIPSLKEQKAIAATLSCLDDKIELNNRINKNLEEIAQAIFKSWFVDFEPFQDDEFEDSELGMIPKGWRVGTIDEIAEVSIGGDWGKGNLEPGLVPVICLRGTDLQSLKEFGYAFDAPIRWVKPVSIKKRMINESDILIGGSGIGPVGRSLYCCDSLKDLYGYPIIYSNFCKRVRCRDSQTAIYIEHVIENMYIQGGLTSYINGTSIPNLDVNSLMKHKLLIPDEKAISAFANYKRLFFLSKFSRDNVLLQSIRDNLLPKLMSGEIRVPIGEVQANG
jgi:type I restriction enzyme S subunit